jgi:hypothetical protein
LGPFWRESAGIQAFSGQFPVKLTGNFFLRNREFSFVEQGIQFRGTGNSKRRKRNSRYERRDYAHRWHQQRENRKKWQRQTGWEGADSAVTLLFLQLQGIGLRNL